MKQNCPHIACIMVSGSITRPEDILDVRDNYELDYFISKDRVDQDTLRRALQKAMQRINPVGSTERRRQILLETIEKMQSSRLKWLHNLSFLEEREALQGILVDVETKNQIQLYSSKLKDIENKIKELQAEFQLNSKD